MKISDAFVPRKLSYRREVASGVIEQLRSVESRFDGELSLVGQGKDQYAVLKSSNGEALYIVSNAVPEGIESSNVLRASVAMFRKPQELLTNASEIDWLDEPSSEIPIPTPAEISALQKASFEFKQEYRETGKLGLRPPQIGAVHSMLGHWSVTDEPATVVMPTGTGKTETMLALMAHEGAERLLVLVPSVALREQTVRKFMSMGLLAELGIISPESSHPVVGTLLHELSTPEEVDEMFLRCNVVVGIVQTVARSSDAVLKRIADVVSHVFIDEAHHVAADTWERVKTWLKQRPLVQFTATPYRQDKKRVDGKMVFNYPLKKAQKEDYFRPIRYRPVFEFTQEKGDAAIAKLAVEILRDDLDNGLDHLIMARVNTIKRAEELIGHYREKCPDLNPVVVYSEGMSQTKRREALIAIRSRASRVVVCVNMLGEGFDLPQLKIAALHDVHKSLAITLQFTGRFTRSTKGVGDAAVVVNAGDVSVDKAIRELYSEDPDWNVVIQKLAEGAIGAKERETAMDESFKNAEGSVSVQSLVPKMSTVVYKTKCDKWEPHEIESLVDEESFYSEPSISAEFSVAYFITEETQEVQWGDVKELRDRVFSLYLLHWDPETRLLYINSSNKAHQHLDLAKAVCGDEVELVEGENVFRSLFGIKRLTLMNLGLSDTTGRARRFELINGADVAENLPTARVTGKRKTNLFGRGYDDDGRASIGCSTKGRIWSHEIAHTVSEWVDWCHEIGAKVTNDSITTESVLEGALRPVQIKERPPLVALSVDWHDYTYRRNEDTFSLRFGDDEVPFYEVGLSVTEFSKSGPIKFKVHTDDIAVEYEGVFLKDGLSFRPAGTMDIVAKIGRRSFALSDLFKSEPPKITFEGDNYIEDNMFISIKRDEDRSYRKASIEGWPWKGVDLKKESQRREKRADSIQRHVLDRLAQDPSWELIFDDDSSGESADIVAAKRSGSFIVVRLIHCKFASTGKAAKNVKDLYEVCGQAQKCIRWREGWDDFFNHLKRRERKRIANAQTSRIERGDLKLLVELANTARYRRPKFEVWIVQPGLKKDEVTNEQLALLGAAETFLTETWSIPLHVVGSE